MNERLTNYAIILASGSGKRFQGDIPKQFIKIGGKTILEYSVESFEKSENIDRIIVAVNKEYLQKASEILQDYKKIYKIIPGGETRKDSSYNAIFSIEEDEANVLIHDGARPFVSVQIIDNCIGSLNNGIKALTTTIPTSDTIIEINDDKIKNIPQRENMRRVQTPQGFKLSLIRSAHGLSAGDKNFTDDCGLILKHNLCDISVIQGDINNIKITYPEDLTYANEILKSRNS